MRFLKLNDNLKDCTLLVYRCTNGHNYPIPSIVKITDDCIYDWDGAGITINAKRKVFDLNNKEILKKFNHLGLSDTIILDKEDIKNIKYLSNNVLPTIIDRLNVKPFYIGYYDDNEVCQLYIIESSIYIAGHNNITYDYNPTVNCQVASIRNGNVLISKSKEEIIDFFAKLINSGYLKNQILFDLNEAYVNQINVKFDSSEIVFIQPYVSTNKSKMTMCLINIQKFIDNNQKLFNQQRKTYLAEKSYKIPMLL